MLARWREACRGRKTALKVALLDQRIAAGIGNIYACEALHLARLSPFRRASTIATAGGAPREAANRLADAIKRVLKRAIDRAATASSSARFRVYDREGERCPRRGCGGRITAAHAGWPIDVLLSDLPAIGRRPDEVCDGLRRDLHHHDRLVVGLLRVPAERLHRPEDRADDFLGRLPRGCVPRPR